MNGAQPKLEQTKKYFPDMTSRQVTMTSRHVTMTSRHVTLAGLY